MNKKSTTTKQTAKKAIQPVKSGNGTARKPHSENKAALAAVAPKKTKVVTMPAAVQPVPVAAPVPVTVAPKATTQPAVKKQPADRSDAAKRAWVTIRANATEEEARESADGMGMPLVVVPGERFYEVEVTTLPISGNN